MKKVFLCFISIVIISCAWAQNNHHFEKNKYSTDINCDYPLGYDVQRYLNSAEKNIDLEKYRTIISNGDIDAIENPYLDDLQLGVLNKTELKLFRNMFFAKKGYIFTDDELTKYFNQFKWYEPKSKDVTFTDREQSAIDRIKLFEADATVNYEFEKKSVLWECFNGGADQRGPLLKLNKDKTFEYTPAATINRVQNVCGTWNIANNKIVLSVKSENVFFGGYVADDTTPYIKNGTPVSIVYNQPIIITLPINKSETFEKYNFKFGESWIRIGSGDWYISR